MDSRNVTAELYSALRQMLPDIPEHATKLTLKLETGTLPIIEVDYMAAADGEIKAPVEMKSEAYALCPVDDGVVDVTSLSDTSRKYKKLTADEVGAEPSTLTVKVDAVASEVLRRYSRSQDVCNAMIIDELRKLREEMQEMNQMTHRAIVINYPGE